MNKHTLSTYLDHLLFIILSVGLLFTPLISISFLKDSSSSQTLILFVIVFICLILKSIQWLIDRKLVLTHTPFDIPLFLLLGIMTLSSIFLPSPVVSILGTQPIFEGSFLSFVTLMLFYLCLTSSVRNLKLLKILSVGVIFISLISLAFPYLKVNSNPFPGLNTASLSESVNILPKSILASPVFGQGLNMFPFIYNINRQTQGNNQPVYSYNQLLQTLPTLGIAGFLIFGFLIIRVLSKVLPVIFSHKKQVNFVVSFCLILYLINLFLNPFTTSNFLIFFGLMAVWSNLNYHQNKYLLSEDIGFIKKVFLSFFIISFLGSFIIFKLAQADYFYSAGEYFYVKKASQLNPFSDTYQVALSQAAFAQAQAIADLKRPTNTLTENDQVLIKNFLIEALDLAKKATETNPLSSNNWLNLALLNQNISRGDNSFRKAAEEAFTKAVLNDPKNINLHLKIQEATSSSFTN